MNDLVIKDTSKIISSILFFLMGGGIIMYNLDVKSKDKTLFIAIGFILVIYNLLKLRVNCEGIVISTKRDEISFPGGGVTFNSFGRNIKNSFFQSFKRYSYKISEIHYISAENKRHVDDKGNVSNSFFVVLTTVNGTAKVEISNREQRDQIYSIIVNLNNMGFPVHNR